MLFRHMSYGATVAAPPATISLGVRTSYSPNLNQTTHTFSVVLGGTVDFLLVKLAMFNSTANWTAVRWGGSGGTLMTEAINVVAGAGNQKSAIYRLVNPTTGTADVHVTLNLAGRLAAEAVGLIGVDASTPIADAAGPVTTTTATSLAGVLDPSGGNNWCEVCIGKAGDTETYTPTGGVTETLDVDAGNFRFGTGFINPVDAQVTPGFSWGTVREAAMTAVLLLPG
jgi:hypothetical protein